jgi:hypothetical protein
MKVLAVGADREGVRILLFDRTQIIIDTQIRELAAQRNERTLIEAQLHTVHESWSSIDRFIVLSVPHSHTSVRVITTIVRTSAWYLGRPVHILDCETLDQFSVDDLRDYIKRIALK